MRVVCRCGRSFWTAVPDNAAEKMMAEDRARAELRRAQLCLTCQEPLWRTDTEPISPHRKYHPGLCTQTAYRKNWREQKRRALA